MSTDGFGGAAHTDEATAVPEARASELPAPLTAALSLPGDFRFDAVHAAPAAAPAPTPTLGPLAHFKATFTGNGFNQIFRPDSSVTPTHFPVPVGGSDNVLELNLTHETLSFAANLGSVPNRGFVQGDAFLNGVPYLQTINDVTTGRPIGIHFEPGMWVIVPPTTDPAGFLVRPPKRLTGPTDIKVTYTQIQYTQRVILNFNGLSWPHVSVATLVPEAPVPVPAGAFA